MRMDKKTKLIVVGLLVIIAILAGLVVYGHYTGWFATQQQASFVAGYQQGATDAIKTIAQQSVTCNQVPLVIDNQTYNMINVACLQAAGSTAEQT